MTLDQQIRLTAFNWLTEQVRIHGDVLDRRFLEQGFSFNNQKIPLVSPQGIFKPRLMDYPLSITTTTESKYEDSETKEGFLLYKYRGTNPNHTDNVGLRKAFQLQIPLIYLKSLVPGRYSVHWPVFIVGDDPQNLSFTVAFDDLSAIKRIESTINEDSYARRAYITSTVKVRIHQRIFREQVLYAYNSQCSLCRIKHVELLDAAHIIPDTEPESKPIINNGISLCKLHHAAFDSYFLGITPDYIIKIRKDVLDEEDGPTLQHALKDIHDEKIILPKEKKKQPNPDFLNWRYEKFKHAV